MLLTIIIARVITAQKYIPIPLFRTGCEIGTVSAIVELTYKIYIRKGAVN